MTAAFREELGIENADSDPAALLRRALGIRKLGFDPGKGLEQGSEGLFGLRDGEIDPVRPLGSAYGIRKKGFDPGKA